MREITVKEKKEIIETDKYFEDRGQYIKRMNESGYVIYTPDDNEVLLDLDDDVAYTRFTLALTRLRNEFGGVKAKWRASKSGLPHRHVVVLFPIVDFDAPSRIALQAIMGSDLTREMLSLFRHWHEDPCPSLLCIAGDINTGWVEV